MSREHERRLRRIETAIGQPDPDSDDLPELTDKKRERLRALVGDVEELDGPAREHYENIQDWLEAEREADVEAEGPHELTPAEKALLDLLMASDGCPPVMPEPYRERYPDAPVLTDGGHSPEDGVRYGGLPDR